MTDDDIIEQKIKDLLEKNHRVSQPEIIETGSKLENDLGLDSLDIVELMMECGNEFSIRTGPDWDEEAYKEDATFGDVVSCVRKNNPTLKPQ